MNYSVDVSELSKYTPLILGEAPIAEGSSAFPPWLDGRLPESTRELLDLAFSPKQNRTKEEAEAEHAQLHSSFDLANLLPGVQPLKNPESFRSGYKLDTDKAMLIISAEIIEAVCYKEGVGDPPVLYGRVVIIFGRAGEALLRALARLPADKIGFETMGDLENQKKEESYIEHPIIILGTENPKCVIKFIWVYHPNHFCSLEREIKTFKKKKPEDQLGLKSLQLTLDCRRDAVRKVLQSGLRGESPDCSGSDGTYRLVSEIIDDTLQVAA